MATDEEGSVLVIGAGLGRTGTNTLKKALSNLGYKPYHMFEISNNRPEFVPLWQRLIAMTPARRMSSGIWDEVLVDFGYDACVDFPTTCYWNEIQQYYEMKTGKKAKIILTERDSAEQWYQSAITTIFPRIRQRMRLACRLVSWHGISYQFFPIFSFFDDQFENKELCIERYNEHNEYVKQTVPKDQLLVLNVRDGYNPLIDFLEISDQSILDRFRDQPFERSNNRQSFRAMLNDSLVDAVHYALILSAAALVAGTVGFAWKSYQRYNHRSNHQMNKLNSIRDVYV